MVACWHRLGGNGTSRSRALGDRAADQNAKHRRTGGDAERRDAAESRPRALVGRRSATAGDGRTDPRGGRRGEGGNLRIDESAHRCRRRHPDDLLRAAGSARHERSVVRDAARPDRGRVCRRHRDRRAGAAGGAGDGVVNGAAGPRALARRFGAVAGLLVLCLLLWILTPYFLTVANLLNVMEQTAINAIVAVGMTYVIISGGIDLSVGSLLAVAGVVLALALKADWPAPIAAVAALGTGAICGLANGVGIAFGKLPPFIMTLGMMSVARGAALLLTDGRPVSGFGAGFRSL